MKTYLTLSAIALAAAATLSSGAMAQTAPAPDFTVTGNFGVTSDYRFRGISQNNLDPAFQGGFDVAHKSGLYVGTWGSNVSKWTADNGSLEMDLYGGYKTEVSGVGVDIGVIAYTYPGSVKNYGSNTEEAYVGLTYGPLVFKTSYVLSKNYFASLGRESGITGNGNSARGTMYYDLTLSQEIAPKLVASIHAGYTDFAADDKYISNGGGGKFSYADYNVGLAYDLGNGFTASAKYFWNDVKAGTKSYAGKAAYGSGGNLYKDGVAVSLTKAF
jgi:uncharacterized protein (TIGR02001 family)